jgi:biotin synthase
MFYGDRLLTTGNPEAARDHALFARLGLHSMLPAQAANTGSDAVRDAAHGAMHDAAPAAADPTALR